MSLFIPGKFKSHSSNELFWKIDCDNLTDQDLSVLAKEVDENLFTFGKVHGVPRGGLRFAEHLRYYTLPQCKPLIVDDVLTTGRSMEEMKKKLNLPNAIGLVIFARGPCPDWVTPIFQLHASFT